MKAILRPFLLLLISIVLGQCTDIKKPDTEVRETKIAILNADREAPTGWVYLTIYQDSSFEFKTADLRAKTKIYSGNVKQKADTLFFMYKDSVPKAGKTALINERNVKYIDGSYPEILEIRTDTLVRNVKSGT